MKLHTKEKYSSAWWLVFSVFICATAFRYSMGTLHQPGPGFFPFLGGAILGVLSIFNFFKAALEKDTLENEAQASGPESKWGTVVLTLLILFAYPLLLSVIGLAPATFILFVILLRFIEPVKWPTVIKVTLVVVILTSLIFQYWLKIQFPKGIFGI